MLQGCVKIMSTLLSFGERGLRLFLVDNQISAALWTMSVHSSVPNDGPLMLTCISAFSMSSVSRLLILVLMRLMALPPLSGQQLLRGIVHAASATIRSSE